MHGKDQLCTSSHISQLRDTFAQALPPVDTLGSHSGGRLHSYIARMVELDEDQVIRLDTIFECNVILEDGVPATKNSIHKFSVHPRSKKGRGCVCVRVGRGEGG